MAKFGIGQSVRRLEDPRLLTGGGRYTDDTKLSAPAVRMHVLRSPHAHADIRKIDTAAANARCPRMVGVVGFVIAVVLNLRVMDFLGLMIRLAAAAVPSHRETL